MTRHLHDFYPTPRPHVEASLALLTERFSLFGADIIDPGAGDGIWGTVMREQYHAMYITGYELRPIAKPYAYTEWHRVDFLNATITRKPHVVVGNPPYSMAEQFVRRSLDIVRPRGYVLFLLRLGFLEGRARYAGLWQQFPPRVVGVFADRPSFSGDGRSDASAYAAFLWQRGYRGETKLRFLTAKPVAVSADVEQRVLV